MPEYFYRNGARFQPGALRQVPAQVVGDRIQTLIDQYGGHLAPEVVVEDARPRESPLHPHFEWNDRTAARAHRLDQARNLIRSVAVVYRDDVDPNRPPHRITAFVNLRDDSGSHAYYPIVSVMSDADKRAKMIRQAWNEMIAFRRRYEALIEFAGIFAMIDDLEESLPPVLDHDDAA